MLSTTVEEDAGLFGGMFDDDEAAVASPGVVVAEPEPALARVVVQAAPAELGRGGWTGERLSPVGVLRVD